MTEIRLRKITLRDGSEIFHAVITQRDSRIVLSLGGNTEYKAMQQLMTLKGMIEGASLESLKLVE